MLFSCCLEYKGEAVCSCLHVDNLLFIIPMDIPHPPSLMTFRFSDITEKRLQIAFSKKYPTEVSIKPEKFSNQES